MAQQIIPAAQLLPKFKGIGICNNYVVLQSTPCSPECKIVGKILLDHPLSYALTATADVPVVYLQQFWKTVIKMPEIEDTIIFKLDTNIEIIESFMNRVGYLGVVDKVSDFYMKFLAQPWQTMFKAGEGEKDEQSYDDVDDSDNRLEPGSHKKNLEHVDDIDDKEEAKVDEKEGNEMGSLEIRTEKMRTPISTTPISPRINLSLDKNIARELTDTDVQASRIYDQGHGMKIATKDLIENNLKPCLAKTIIEDRDDFRSDVPDFNSKEFSSHAPQIIEELFKNYVRNNVIQVHPSTTTSTEITSSADLQQHLYLKMKSNPQDQANDPALWDVLKRKFEKTSTSNTSCKDDEFHSQRNDDHQEDDALPEGEKRVKDKRLLKEWDAWVEETIIDEDENGNTEEKKYILSIHKIHAERFPEANLEEKINRWRVHDFLLGIKSYQVKVNLTAPTLTFPGIEAHEPYSIIDKPTTGLIYLNNKDEKRVMYLVEIVKFCDATVEKVLKEVKLKIFQSEPWKKPPLLGELDRDIMGAFEREITKRLSHRE
ncbi:hypothetical protein Tco_0987589 [Tanacetum coccineum]